MSELSANDLCGAPARARRILGHTAKYKQMQRHIATYNNLLQHTTAHTTKYSKTMSTILQILPSITRYWELIQSLRAFRRAWIVGSKSVGAICDSVAEKPVFRPQVYFWSELYPKYFLSGRMEPLVLHALGTGTGVAAARMCTQCTYVNT